MQGIELIFSIAILVMSVVVHEVSHGYAAYALGDPTAKYAGRLTLNPLKHLDLFGSVILPILLVLTKAGFVIGWAKPVPYNLYNLRNQRWGELLVAFAGIAANLCLAIIFSLVVRIGLALQIFPAPFIYMSTLVVVINLVLAFFNIMPLPPLDGSKILFALLPPRYTNIRYFLERWGFVLVLVLVVFLWEFILPAVLSVAGFLMGVPVF